MRPAVDRGLFSIVLSPSLLVAYAPSMKKNPLLPILIGVFVILSIVVSWSAVRHYFSMKELQDLQGRVLNMRQTMTQVQALVTRCLEYRRQNPAIEPILKDFGIPLTNSNTQASGNPAAGLDQELTPLN
jgi:hypothetical protein